MERDIKDYMHLYTGCDVVTNTGVEQLVSVGILGSDSRRFRTIRPGMSYTNEWDESNKIILRSLSDITEEVMTEIFDKCYTCVYSNQRDFPVEFVDQGGDNGIKAFDGKYNYGLTVNVTGILFSVDGAFLTYPVFEITRILLKNGYDLFDLIPDGLAIDATTINKATS